MPRRVTQQDVATLAGVNRATVSLALRRHPSIPSSTRERILRIAEKIGYVPDPMLSALAQYRHALRPVAYHGNLVWLTISGLKWENSPHYFDYYTGAKSRAASFGYQLEIVEFDPAGMRAERIASILRARNIGGILLCPQPTDRIEFDFPWEDFSPVTFGYSLMKPEIHTVSAAHYRSVRRIMQELVRRKYRRIGLAITRGNDNRVDGSYLGAYLGSELVLTGTHACRPFYKETFERSALISWIKKEKPDVIVTNEFYRILPYLKEAGIRVPEQIGAVCASLPKVDADLAGIVENSIHIGEIAVDLLVAMINRGERGVPEYPQRIHVEGKWSEGRSLTRQAP